MKHLNNSKTKYNKEVKVYENEIYSESYKRKLCS